MQSQPKDDGSLLQRRTELHKEVENAKRALANQNSLTAVETVKVEQSIAEEERLLYEQSDLHIEVVELTRLATIKVWTLDGLYNLLNSCTWVTLNGHFIEIVKTCN